MKKYARIFKEKTFNRNIKDDIKEEILKFHIKSENDCYKVGNQLGGMMRTIIDEISEEEGFSEKMLHRLIVGLRASV